MTRAVADTVPDGPCAAVSLIQRSDGRVLCVWNTRYIGWMLPGGKVEEGETLLQAQQRELREETGLGSLWESTELVHDAPTGIASAHVPEGRGRHVYVFRVRPHGVARCMEPNCPVAWLHPDDFLRQSPVRAFYTSLFGKLGWPVPEAMPEPELFRVHVQRAFGSAWYGDVYDTRAAPSFPKMLRAMYSVGQWSAEFTDHPLRLGLLDPTTALVRALECARKNDLRADYCP